MQRSRRYAACLQSGTMFSSVQRSADAAHADSTAFRCICHIKSGVCLYYEVHLMRQPQLSSAICMQAEACCDVPLFNLQHACQGMRTKTHPAHTWLSASAAAEGCLQAALKPSNAEVAAPKPRLATLQGASNTHWHFPRCPANLH